MPWKPLPTGDRHERGPAPVTRSLDRLVKDLGAPSASTMSGVFARWPEIVGPQMAAHTRPLAVRAGRLLVAVDDPAWAPQVRFLEAQIVARVREVLGDDDVGHVDVRVRPGDS